MAADEARWQQAADEESESVGGYVDLSTLVIAIDGPAGAGKSTVARGVARALGCRYLDTGAVYRALTWAVLDRGADPDDERSVMAVLADFRLDLSTDPDHVSVAVGGHDVTTAIRGAAVTAAVSAVSAVPAVRTQLVALQQSIIGAGGIVVEGRDIGTVVCPTAPVKIFLTANAAVRATRRYAEGDEPNLDIATIEASLARRDHLDSSRAVSPLTAASDAVAIDSTGMDAAAVISAVLDVVAARTSSSSTPQ
jgi:CMP/dCMP kinase